MESNLWILETVEWAIIAGIIALAVFGIASDLIRKRRQREKLSALVRGHPTLPQLQAKAEQVGEAGDWYALGDALRDPALGDAVRSAALAAAAKAYRAGLKKEPKECRLAALETLADLESEWAQREESGNGAYRSEAALRRALKLAQDEDAKQRLQEKLEAAEQLKERLDSKAPLATNS